MNKRKIIKLPFLKRFFDLIFSVLLLLILSPFLLFLFFLIILEYTLFPSSRGSIFYKEVRISGGKKILFYKFRIFKEKILKNTLKKNGMIHTKNLEKKKENMTFYGRLLKQIYMDELPQLFLVVLGKMTLVGPRPTNIYNSEQQKNRGDFTRYRMVCGLTGPFQSEKGRNKKSQYIIDSEYIDFIDTNSGIKVIFYDLLILLKTILTVLKAEGI